MNPQNSSNTLASRYPGLPIKKGTTGLVDYSNRYPHLKSAGNLNTSNAQNPGSARKSLNRRYCPSNPELATSKLVGSDLNPTGQNDAQYPRSRPGSPVRQPQGPNSRNIPRSG